MFSSITVLNLGVMVLLQRGSSVFLNEQSDDKICITSLITLASLRGRGNIMRKLEEITMEEWKTFWLSCENQMK